MEMLQQAIGLSLKQEELVETKNQSEDLEEEVEPKEEGCDEELDSDEEMIQLAVAMSLAQEKEIEIVAKVAD